MTGTDPDAGATDGVTDLARPLREEADLTPLLDRVADARHVLVGEASHGTHDYYDWRSAITRRLIVERGFSFVAVEGDWAPCRHVHHSVTLAEGAPTDPHDVLVANRHWPSWLWGNEETVAFCRWLRDHNARQPETDRVGWYGLDAYPLWGATRVIMRYLAKHVPDYVDGSLDAFARRQPLVPDEHLDAVLDRLRRLHGRVPSAYAGSPTGLEAGLDTDLVAGADAYYRAMIRADTDAWNARDSHLARVYDRLLAHHGVGAKGVVWAHNTHVGDARACGMARSGMLNLGQLVRERHGGGEVVAIGFAGGRGEVLAGPRRGEPGRVMTVPAAPEGSLEALLAERCPRPSLFVFPRLPTADWLTAEHGQRAIGVTYDASADAETSVPTRVADRYDALCWLPATTAVRALHRDPARSEEPDTLRAVGSELYY